MGACGKPYDARMAAKGTIERTRGALRSPDFRRLLWIRLASQFADGLFQVSLIASIVFSPGGKSTTVGLLKATLIVALPYSVIGPFTGVFIDRWRRRRIMAIAPLIKVGFVGLVLFDPVGQAVPFFAGALIVLSVNRFFLSTTQAVVPRLVPTEDLLMANSVATVGGTVALLAGIYLGGQIADAFGSASVVIGAGALWLAASLIASRIGSDLAPHTLPEDPGLIRHELRRVGAEFRDGIGRLFHTPRAIGPITSISLDQIGQGVVLTLSLVVFRERFGEGVGSFSNLIGAGGVGVLVGIVTIGALEDRFAKERIVAGAFLIGGAVLLTVSFVITGLSVLLASFMVGLTFAWKKIPIDTMVQESLPDGYRGRIFAIYDVAYNLARLLAAALAIPMLNHLGVAGSVAAVGIVFLVWTPVLPRWIGRTPALIIRFREGTKAEEWPRTVVWGGVEEPVEVERSWTEERDGVRMARFRLALRDGSLLDVARTEPDGEWRIEREAEDGVR
jgi:predicted MFS family arabinose efflux permease